MSYSLGDSADFAVHGSWQKIYMQRYASQLEYWNHVLFCTACVINFQNHACEIILNQ